ncbi:hypothetical protein SEA_DANIELLEIGNACE_6 [Arthrobacter phage DanielleIgnace]|nr:hypothetical protein SEA_DANIELLEIGNACE_6 [Arthrobacter phage DanielleIgnace]
MMKAVGRSCIGLFFGMLFLAIWYPHVWVQLALSSLLFLLAGVVILSMEHAKENPVVKK